MQTHKFDLLISLLEELQIELPTWGVADTGTRFGKFAQAGAADKFADAGKVHELSGCCPSVGAHVFWDFEPGQEPKEVGKLAKANGLRIGSLNPNLFQEQEYMLESFANGANYLGQGDPSLGI